MTTRIAQMEAILEAYTSIPFEVRGTCKSILDVVPSSGKRGFVDFSTIQPDQPFLRTNRQAFKVTVQSTSAADLETIIDSILTLEVDYCRYVHAIEVSRENLDVAASAKDGYYGNVAGIVTNSDLVVTYFVNAGLYCKGCVVFPLTDIAGITVDSAALSLHTNSWEGTPTVWIYGVKGDVLSLTNAGNWNTMLANLTTAYAEKTTNTFTDVDVTDIVQEIATAGVATELAFMIIHQAVDGSYFYFDSVESATAGNRPKLDITYSPTVLPSYSPLNYPHKLQVFEGQPRFDGTYYNCEFMIEGYWRVS